MLTGKQTGSGIFLNFCGAGLQAYILWIVYAFMNELKYSAGCGDNAG